MAALVLLCVCLGLGVLVARFAHPPAGLAQGLNWWVLRIALPALVLDLIPRVHFERQFWFLTAANWLAFAGGAVFFALLGRALGWSRGRVGALMLVGGLGNTAFMGYPMIEALRGAGSLPLAVIGDQTGCFTALVFGGTAVTALYAGRALHPAEMLRQLLSFPPLQALVLGVLLGLAGDPWPMLHDLCGRLAATLSPLALFSVGLQQRLRLPRILPALSCGLAWKLLLAPALCWLLGWACGVTGLVLAVGVLQAAMPPMISAAILAEQYGLEPALANAMLAIAILLSLISVPYLSTLLP